MANLKSSSPTIRRTAASSAVSVCQHSRRTNYFYTWLLNVLLGMTRSDTAPNSKPMQKLKTLCFTAFIFSKHIFSTSFFLGLVIPVDEEHSSHLILGVLLTLRYLMPLLQQQDASTSLKGSFGVMRKEADVSPTPEQLIQVRLLYTRCFLCAFVNVLESKLNCVHILNLYIDRGVCLQSGV